MPCREKRNPETFHRLCKNFLYRFFRAKFLHFRKDPSSLTWQRKQITATACLFMCDNNFPSFFQLIWFGWHFSEILEIVIDKLKVWGLQTDPLLQGRNLRRDHTFQTSWHLLVWLSKLILKALTNKISEVTPGHFKHIMMAILFLIQLWILVWFFLLCWSLLVKFSTIACGAAPNLQQTEPPLKPPWSNYQTKAAIGFHSNIWTYMCTLSIIRVKS